jgi:alcohol dehydrogenase class IV
MSQGIALEGMRLVREWLPLTYTNGKDIEARAHMMSAAMMGATAFQKGLGAMHAMSHPIGAVYNTHHGMTNAVVMPYVLQLNRPEIENKISWAADYLGIRGGFDGFFDFVGLMRAGLSVPDRLRDLGVGTDRIGDLVDMALEDPSCGGNPVKLTKANMRALCEAASRCGLIAGGSAGIFPQWETMPGRGLHCRYVRDEIWQDILITLRNQSLL